MKEEYFRGYQSSWDYPDSVPYTPSNFWRTMTGITAIDIIAGEEPELKSESNVLGEPYDEEPSPYHAIFYHTSKDVAIAYRWDGDEGIITLFGNNVNIKNVSKLISLEHQCLNAQYEGEVPDDRREHWRKHRRQLALSRKQ